MGDKMAKVLITGGAGFIGSYICRELIKQGHQPIILDGFVKYVAPLKDKQNIDFKERFDGIADKVIIERGFTHHFEVIYDVLLRHQPEYIIHMAALPLVKLPNINVAEAQEGSIVSTGVILSVVNKLQQENKMKLKRFVYTSSSMVYGNFLTPIVDENTIPNPIEIYGTVKLAGEIMTRGLCNTYNIDYTIIRPSAVYGARDSNHRVTQIFVENAYFGNDIKVNGKDERLDFSYVEDVAKGFVLAAFTKEASKETFNITGGNSRTLFEFAEIVKKHFPKVSIVLTERESGRPVRGTLDITKAKTLLGYNPEYDIEKGISEYIKYLEERRW